MDKKAFGSLGEDIASNYLVNKGFSVLERNYRYKRCEIDLIVKKNNVLVFVEVKMRSNQTFGQPEDFVSDAQAERIMEAAEQYMEKLEDMPPIVRFDIVSILKKGKSFQVDHFEDAFY